MSEQDISSLPLGYKNIQYLLYLKKKLTCIEGFILNKKQQVFLDKFLFMSPELMSKLREIKQEIDYCYKTLEDTHNKINELKESRFKLMQ